MTSVLPKPDGLPTALTSLVGRRRELAEVRQALSGTRLLTLTGVGGVGKTRLALRAAADLARAFPDGVRLVELGDLTSADHLPSTVAAVLGLHDDRPYASLRSFVAHRRMLLVLDGCEHLLPACAELANRLLSASRGLQILATSRQRLDVVGERTLTVPPLAVPERAGDLTPVMLDQYDGVVLFVDRAKAVLPGFAVTEENCDVVVQLCQALDGLPLAIELAAARLRGFSLPQILQRQTDRFAFLTVGNRSAPARQRTLQASIDWSYEMCEDAERTLWARLSVFAGGFDLAAAESVCCDELLDPAQIPSALADLIDKSIVIRTESDVPSRFRMLETIRQYGRDRLAMAGSREAIARRHRDWCTNLARAADAAWLSPDQDSWHHRIGLERANLLAALEFCLAEDDEYEAALNLATSVCTYRKLCMPPSEGRRWLDRVLARATAPSIARFKALSANAWLALIQGDNETARELAQEGLRLAEAVDDAPTRAAAVQLAGVVDFFDGDLAAAEITLGDAVDRFAELGRTEYVQVAFFQQLMVRCFRGDPHVSGALLGTQESTRLVPNSVNDGYVSWVDAVDRCVQGDYAAAASRAVRALRIGFGGGDRWLGWLGMEVLACSAAAAGESARAARLLGAAETVRKRVGSKLGFVPVRRLHSECRRAARSALGDDAFAAKYRDGTQLSEEQAVSYATRDAASARQINGHAAAKSPLTRRERQIAELVAKGMTNKEVASTLVIATRTAEAHVGHILTKLGFTARSQIGSWAAEQARPAR